MASETLNQSSPYTTSYKLSLLHPFAHAMAAVAVLRWSMIINTVRTPHLRAAERRAGGPLIAAHCISDGNVFIFN